MLLDCLHASATAVHYNIYMVCKKSAYTHPLSIGHVYRLGLLPYAGNACGSYSGGNKRKLSVAVALVGDLPLVLLDEPSTGMDPAARRFLWSVLQVGETVHNTGRSWASLNHMCTALVPGHTVQ